ncbi:MAG: glycosyltransferase [Bacteroidales bacterium]|nr:glycosyltransferase [Bacteroidales bacterium]MDP3003091.1 glycosyltransferase [Bacteroidales bacterium]
MVDHDNVFLLVIFSVFALAATIQVFYYLFYYLSVYLYKPSVIKTIKEPVSIIICARDEAENLSNFLPAVLEQDYPDYEVIVVNDCSEDNSYDVLGKYLMQYPHLKISTINKDPKFTHNKKFAQFIGIKAAKKDILLFTDADCQPESDKWLEGMTSHFDDKISFVLGYGGYLKEKGLLNRYIRYDSMTIAMQYLGMAIRGIPYMGVGRNLAYRRSVFFTNKGYGAHNHLISGDDDLFVNTNASGRNTCVEFRNGTHTRSIPCSGIKEWITQKKRYLTTASYYKLRDKLLLITEPATRIFFYSAFIVLLSFTFLWPYVLAVFGIRLLTQIIIFALVQKKLNESGLITYSLFFDIFSPVINSIVYLSNIWSKPGKNIWK